MSIVHEACTHGADCEVHPATNTLHNFDPETGVSYPGAARPCPPPERLGDADLIMTAAEISERPDEWKAQRRRDPVTGQWRLTASELASVLDFAPPSQPGPFSLYHAKVDGIETFDGNDRTDLGLFLENHVAPRFARAHPELEIGDGGLYRSRRHPWLGATFDRVAYDVRFNCDGRCPGTGEHVAGCREEWHEELSAAGPVQIKSWAQRADFGPGGSDVIPLHLRIQLLAEMEVMGSDIGYEPVIFLPSGQVITYVIDRDDAAERDIRAIVAAGEEFIRCLDEELPPEVDWRPATRTTLQRLYKIDPQAEHRIPVKLAQRMDAARRAKDAATRRFTQVQNEIRARSGSAGRVVAWDAAAGEARTVVTRSGGPRAGYSVAPNEFVETMQPGNWGKS